MNKSRKKFDLFSIIMGFSRTLSTNSILHPLNGQPFHVPSLKILSVIVVDNNPSTQNTPQNRNCSCILIIPILSLYLFAGGDVDSQNKRPIQRACEMDQLESSTATAAAAVFNGQPPVLHHDQDSSSAEYLQCRIAEDPAKDAEKGEGEGSDSGVEFGAGSHLRRLSSNEEDLVVAPSPVTAGNLALQESQQQAAVDDSGIPFSETNGLLQRHDVFAATEGQFSCDSSVLSFCSEENLLGDSKAPLNGGGGFGSEGGGSESSSVYNQPVMASSSGSVKKRVNLLEGNVTMARNMSVSTTQLSKAETLGRAKFRALSVTRVGPPSLLTKDRARSKDRGQLIAGGLGGSSSPLVRTSSVRRPPKPDSLPVSSPMAPPAKRMSTLSRTQSVRTPGTTPTASDSGRWPYGPQTPRSTTTSRNTPGGGWGEVMVKTRLGQMSLDQSSAQSTFDKYATMPRRRRERSADQKTTESSTRSSSISRDRLIGTSRMSISTMNNNINKATPSSSTSAATTPKMRSVVRRLTQKVKIFQETSSQTAITNDDLENAFAGRGQMVVDMISQREKQSIGTQSEIRDKEMETLRRRVKHLTDEGEQLRNALGGKTILLTSVEQQLIREKEAKLKLQKELQCNSERVVAILEQHSGIISGDAMMDSTDSLMMLESKVTTDSQVVTTQKQELKKMRHLCMALRLELDEALERERALIADRESDEMQEFLQIEKSVLTDAAKGEEKAKWQNVVEKKDQEIKWLLEECRHLVRFCEQRR